MPTKRLWFLRLLPYALLIGGLILGIGLVILLTRPADQRVSKIEAAVRATFPKFCTQGDHRINVVPSLTGTKPDDWDIHCDPNPIYLSKDTPMMTINTATCDVTGLPSLTLMEQYPELFNTPKLANCPLQ